MCSISLAQTSATTKSTSGGALDVKLEPIPNPIKNDQEINYKITFLQKGTDTVQRHVDYDFIILKENTTRVFKPSQQAEQLPALLRTINNTSFPLLHATEGTLTIPFTLEEPGNYTIRVPVMGINFIPMATEYADFPVKVE